MGTIKYLKNEKIREALQGLRRQYFVGNLSRPQSLPYFKSEIIEIGLTSYDSFNTEPAHKHSEAVEFQYMLSGRTQYMDVETEDVFEFVKGDFYMIEPGTVYAQRSKPGTEIIFIKVPSINDKIIVDELSNSVQNWMLEKLYSVRKDYYYDENAPQANSIVPAAAVAIVKDNKILMLKRRDNKKWTMPGGTMEFGESIVDCAVREVMEESGIKVEVTDVIGTYTDPNIRVAYSDGEVRQEFTIVYAGKFSDDSVTLDDESTDYKWVELLKVDELELADSQRRRLKDVIAYYNKGEKRFG